MKTLISLVLAGLLTSAALATVSVQVYRADETTPLAWADPNIPDVYQDIMVGTRLALFVVSDANEADWSGGMYVSRDNWSRGTLTGRGYNETTWNYDGSILPASGWQTYIDAITNAYATHVSLSVDTAQAGEWIVLDYRAQAPGTCDIGVFADEGKVPPGYDARFDDAPPADAVWIQDLSFHHVPSRDYDGDATVNFVDYALWANQWQQTLIPDPNTATPGDLNADDLTDVADLALFCEYWLERTDIQPPSSEPNEPDATVPDDADADIL